MHPVLLSTKPGQVIVWVKTRGASAVPQYRLGSFNISCELPKRVLQSVKFVVRSTGHNRLSYCDAWEDEV